MGEATLVTRLEASADVPLAAPAVWEVLLDGTRWPDWLAAGDPPARAWRRHGILPRLDAVTAFRGNARQPEPVPSVGDMRQETAVVGVPFGFGARRITWRTVVTDVEFGRTLECESPSVGGYLLEWRLRLTVLPTGIQPLPSWFILGDNPVPSADGPRVNERERQTGSRVHVQLSYRPAGLFARMYNRMRLRSILKERLGSWLSGLTHSLTLLSDLESRALGEPIRYIPEPPRPPRPAPDVPRTTRTAPDATRPPRQLPAEIAQRLASRAEPRPGLGPQPGRQSPVAGLSIASGGGIVPPSAQPPAPRAPDAPQRRQATGGLGMETRIRAEGPGGTVAAGRARPSDEAFDHSSSEWGAVSGTSAVATLVRPVEAPAEASQVKWSPVAETPLLVVPTAEETAYEELVATVIATTSPDVVPLDPIAEPGVDVPPVSLYAEVQDWPASGSLVADDHGGDLAPSVEMPLDPHDMATANFVEGAHRDVMDCGQALPVSRGTSASSDVMSGLIAEVIARAMTLAPVVRTRDPGREPGTQLGNDGNHELPGPAILDTSSEESVRPPPSTSTFGELGEDRGHAETSLLLRADRAGAPTTVRDFMAWMSKRSVDKSGGVVVERNPAAVDAATLAGFSEGAVSAREAVTLPVPVPPRPSSDAGGPGASDT
jgi:hypothetical protein